MPQTSNIGRFGYTGQAWLPELGLWYHKARMYAPGLGRFLQTDPIGYAGGMNLYAYAGLDPINYADPDGLAKNCVTIPGSSVLVGDLQTVTATRTYCQNGPDVNRGPSSVPSGGGGGGTVTAATVAGAQGGPVGALARLGIGVGVGIVLAQDLLPEKFGSLVDSGGAAASGGLYGFLSSQYDPVVKSVFSNAPGVAQIGGSAVANVVQHVMQTSALTGAVGAARWGAAAGVGYLGGYLATYQLTYNTCMTGS